MSRTPIVVSLILASLTILTNRLTRLTDRGIDWMTASTITSCRLRVVNLAEVHDGLDRCAILKKLYRPVLGSTAILVGNRQNGSIVGTSIIGTLFVYDLDTAKTKVNKNPKDRFMFAFPPHLW
jgi:hypothetical protein